ncbi:DMT family transporter [Alteromonas gilva]|uniref:DMT family transporter n=1 Tax=Alteromonas gilva TaxID=2987522 RepID=A0ABT5L1R8_9ALTE|nr:DMT family transporter [Alteromonas gilva]MDC8830990.1 DMT family transporter [Alteromonas gilva]
MDSQYRPLYGFCLSLTTAVLWGVLPLFLTVCLQAMDSQTITLYRFVAAAILVGAWLLYRRQLPKVHRYRKAIIVLAIACTFMLVVNYVFNVAGLQYLSPGSVQVFMQVAPFALMIGGVFLYKEHFSRLQFWGAGSLLIGLMLFFNQRLPQIIASDSEDSIGIIFTFIAAVTWAGYALCQKPLMKNMSAMQLTLIIYILGSFILLPFTSPFAIASINEVQGWALLFCCLNTFIAYGAFTEAMRVWYASRVSAVIATAPVFTFISMASAEALFPGRFEQPPLGPLAIVGAAMVISGSVMAALGRGKR